MNSEPAGKLVPDTIQGWFALSSPRDTESNKVNINLTVDPDKAKADAEKVKDKTTELGDRARDTVKQDNR